MPSILVPFRVFPTATAVEAVGSPTRSPAVDCRRLSGLDSFVFTPASVAGTPDMKIEMEVSENGVDWTDETDINPLVASTLTTFAGTPEGPHALSFPPTLANFIRLVLTGVNANPADALITGTILGREQI